MSSNQPSLAAIPPSLQVSDITVRYGALVALSNLNWKVVGGEILGIIGPNGAGKSSCFAAVTNCVIYTGTVVLDGENVSQRSTNQLALLGLRRTFQQNSFFGDLTVLQNAEAALVTVHGTPLYEAVLMPWRLDRRTRSSEEAAKTLLEDFGIGSGYHSKVPSAIPYGVQRLLSIALAYAKGARVLLVDEPAAGVGGEDMMHLAALLLRLKERGVALVVIEHHMDLIMSIADRIVVIDAGKHLAEGPPAAIKTNTQVIEAYLGRTE
ncbi:ATP-binding cassette domain-containing protein [Bradyrhizobium sp. 200]|uniref:ABC transporter ATP-binding protein n=1 Tax=Bradyrhizobium sp. 200 TaxID=2782665 RepID=UPI00320A242C